MKRTFYTLTLLLWGIGTILVCIALYPLYLAAFVWNWATNRD